jgi:hypothetical protein
MIGTITFPDDHPFQFAQRLEDWLDRNSPRPELYFAVAAATQFEKWFELGQTLELTPHVVSTHMSKSCKLPVVAFRMPGGWVLLRDNFYDINLLVVWDSPIDFLSMDDVYGEPQAYSWYAQTLDQVRGYTFRHWTNEEIADPRILRVKVTTAADPKGHWSAVSAEAKDRWAERSTSVEWLQDWGGHAIPTAERDADGRFCENTKFYRFDTPHLQGLREAFRSNNTFSYFGPFQPGQKAFVCVAPPVRCVELLHRLKAGT